MRPLVAAKWALCTCLVALPPLTARADEPATPGGPTVKVGVIPFAALSGDVPQRAGSKAAAMLMNELKNTESVQVVEPKRPPAAEPWHDTLAKAKSLFEQAQQQRAQHKFRLAEESLLQATQAYQAGAAGLADVAELQDAYALLSAVQYNTGKDDEGLKSVTQAIALAPARELPLAATSPLFSRLVTQVRKNLQAAPKGSLLLESTPAGAAASVDGLALGGTPLMVRSVPPGLHVWKVQLPSGDATGGTVEVQGGKTAKVSGQIAGNDPESRLLATLSQNKIDRAAVAAAKEEAGAMEAELVIFGALTRDGKNLSLDGFLLDVQSGEVRRLATSNFDAELLSAGMELYNLAGEVSRKGAKVGDAAQVPGAVAAGQLSSAARVAQAEYGVEASKGIIDSEPTGEGTPQEGSRTPLGQNKSRKPLKK